MKKQTQLDQLYGKSNLLRKKKEFLIRGACVPANKKKTRRFIYKEFITLYSKIFYHRINKIYF